MLIIDAHIHVGQGAYDFTGKQAVENMDAVGIDKSVIFPFPEGFFHNNDILGEVAQYPDRLIPFCIANPWGKQAAWDELEKCFQAGFLGLKLHPLLGGYRLSDHALCDPIFEIAQKYDRPIIVHGSSDAYNCPLEFDRMARRFPRVTLIMAHSGFFGAWEQAIELARDLDNLYLETSRIPAFETATILEELGPDKVIWGSDCPAADLEWEYEKIQHVSRNEQEFEKMAGGNISAILKL